MLFTESEEFGHAKGLDILPGRGAPVLGAAGLKVPAHGLEPGCWHDGTLPLARRACPTARTSTSSTPTIPSAGRPRREGVRPRTASTACTFPPRWSYATGCTGPSSTRRRASAGGSGSWRTSPRLAAEPEATRVIVIPAIDLQGGRCVRLRRGRAADSATVFGDDPVAMARRWAAARGAAAARRGPRRRVRRRAPAAALIRAIVARGAGVPVQVGGGLRDLALLEAALATRRPLGRARHRGGARAARARGRVPRWPGRIIVGVDAVDGRVAVRGWTDGSRSPRRSSRGARRPRARQRWSTPTSRRDGTGRGPNLEATAALAAAAAVPGHRLGRRRRASTTCVRARGHSRRRRARSSDGRSTPAPSTCAAALAAVGGLRRPSCWPGASSRASTSRTAASSRACGSWISRRGRIRSRRRSRYDRQGADELVFLDITASHEGRATMLDVVRRTAEASLHAADRRRRHRRAWRTCATLLRAGADKVSLNTAARGATPQLIAGGGGALRQPVHRGRDRRQAPGGEPGRLRGLHARRPAPDGAATRSPGRSEAATRGAGEILLTSMDRDGTRDGLRPRADARRSPRPCRSRSSPPAGSGSLEPPPRRPRCRARPTPSWPPRSSTSAEHTVPEAKAYLRGSGCADPPRGAA